MLTYIVLNIVVLGLVTVLLALRPVHMQWKRIAVLTSVLLLTTAIFDSLIIWAKLVAYDPHKILGWFVGRAPLEDFAYVLATVILVPYLWKFYADKD